MKGKIYFSLVLAFLAVSFVSCDRENEIKDDTSLIFSFHTTFQAGEVVNLKINANLTHSTVPRRQTTIRTNVEQWEYLKNAFDLEAFKNIGEGEEPEEIIVGSRNKVFTVTIDDETYTFTQYASLNYKNDENFQKMIPFFNAIRNLAWSFH